MNYVLVTGGAGFIGSHLVDELLKKNENVIVIDNFSMGREENLPSHNNLVVVKGDISDLKLIKEVFGKYQISAIFHLGAIASVVASIENPLETHRTNMDATLYLLEEAKKQGNLKKFVFASSAAIFGDDPILPKTEESKIKPLTPYAIDKLASEKYVLAFNKLYNIPTSVLRFFNVFGTRQNPSSPYSGVVSILTEKFRNISNGMEDSFTLYGDGDQTRDFVFVDDVVKALLLVMNEPSATGEVYNVGTGEAKSLKDIITVYEEITGMTLPIIHKEERAGDIKYSYTDISKLKEIGFKSRLYIGKRTARLLETLKKITFDKVS